MMYQGLIFRFICHQLNMILSLYAESLVGLCEEV